MRHTAMAELLAVAAVATHLSFRSAAAELGMSASALSHAVAALEQRLGVRLFNRTTRSVALTEAGEQFLARVRPALRDIAAAMEAVNAFRDAPVGTLRINASEAAARRIFTPIILEFLRRYPDMQVDLVTDGRLVDIVAEGFDAGIRLRDAVPKDMIAVPCSPPLRFVVVGSPGYFGAQPLPKVPGDLLGHRCIRHRMPSGAIARWEFAQHGEAFSVDVKGPLTLDAPALRLEAALQGAGLAWVTEWVAAADMEAGRLVRVLDDWMPEYPGLSLYYPGHRHVPAGLQALIALLREVNAPPRPDAPTA